MGNEICCQEVGEEDKIEHVVQNKERDKSKTQSSITKQELGKKPVGQVQLPSLSPQVLKIFTKMNPFQAELEQVLASKSQVIKQFGSDIYAGAVNDKEVPHGFGRMFKKNGSLYVGFFVNGKAQGQGVYISQSMVYKGKFYKNMANDHHAQLSTPNLEYKGGFSNNEFHQEGREIGSDHIFEGTYEKGFKMLGVFKWNKSKDQYLYSYEGAFNQRGTFEGKATLLEPNGSYEGYFMNGEKHGYGVYTYASGLRYVGNYVRGIKEGEGKIVNYDESIAYEGNFSEGLPHGIGKATSKAGVLIETQWNQGVNNRTV